jgi:hypothetical protein
VTRAQQARIGAALVVALWLGSDHLVAGARLSAALQAVEAVPAEEIATRGRAGWEAYGDPAPEPASAVTLYNLGVLHHQMGEQAQALAHWRAAWELRPRSNDLAHNLALTRADLPDAPPPPVGFALPWMALLTPHELAVVAMLAWLVSAAWLARREQEDHPVGAGMALAVVAAALSVAAWQGADVLQAHPPAVVTDQAIARDAPAFEGKERFTLPLGSEVRAHASQRGFVLVEDGLGRRGWVVSSLLAIPGAGAPP